MNEERDEAIVLRVRGNRYALLAKGAGRFDAMYFARKQPVSLSPGTAISFFGKRSSYSLLSLSEVVVEDVPMVWGRQDIYLLHYLLEVCYFFIPAGSGGRSLCKLFYELYQSFHDFSDIFHKKLVVCKFLAHLGIVPDQEPFHNLAHLLLQTPVDNKSIPDLKLIPKEDVDTWLSWCIDFHPQGKWFKALPLLLTSEQI